MFGCVQGALELEDALSNGLPAQSALDALHVYIENVDKDSLLQLALSSIPEDVRLHGTDTVLQLNQKASFTVCLLIQRGGGGGRTRGKERREWIPLLPFTSLQSVPKLQTRKIIFSFQSPHPKTLSDLALNLSGIRWESFHALCFPS